MLIVFMIVCTAALVGHAAGWLDYEGEEGL